MGGWPPGQADKKKEQNIRLLPPRYADSWETYAALLFLGLFLWPLRAAGPGVIALDLACVAAFLPLYVLAHWASPIRALACIAAIAALGAVAMPGNLGASVFFTYAACLACLTQPAARGVAVALLILALFAVIAVLTGRPAGYILIDAFVTVVVCAIYLQVRHAQARTCTVSLAQDEAATTLVIADDGRGAALYEGAGIRGMADRAKRLGARFEIARHEGTRVRLILPAAP